MSGRLIEAIGRYAPESVKRRILIEASSFDDFIELVEKEGGILVNAEPVIKTKGASSSSTIGRIGTYQYLTHFSSRTAKGREVVFNELHTERFGSERGIGDRNQRYITELKLAITIDTRLREIQERLPQVEVGGLTVEMDSSEREDMWNEAKRLNVDPFPKPQK